MRQACAGSARQAHPSFQLTLGRRNLTQALSLAGCACLLFQDIWAEDQTSGTSGLSSASFLKVLSACSIGARCCFALLYAARLASDVDLGLSLNGIGGAWQFRQACSGQLMAMSACMVWFTRRLSLARGPNSIFIADSGYATTLSHEIQSMISSCTYSKSILIL